MRKGHIHLRAWFTQAIEIRTSAGHQFPRLMVSINQEDEIPTEPLLAFGERVEECRDGGSDVRSSLK